MQRIESVVCKSLKLAEFTATQLTEQLVKVMTREELNNLENLNHNDLKEAELEDTTVETKEEAK